MIQCCNIARLQNEQQVPNSMSFGILWQEVVTRITAWSSFRSSPNLY